MNNCKRRGQSLVELLLVIGLLSLLLPVLANGLISSREGKVQQQQRLAATALLKETEEAVRSVREQGWTTFAVNGTFHPEVSGSSWSLVAGSDTVNGFTRIVDLSDVLRDAAGAIVAAGGTVDPSTKKVTITLSWNTPLSSSVQSVLYLARFDNLSYEQTTKADFDAGIKNGVTVTNTAGGEVMLGAGGAGDWCEPNLDINPLDLPKNGVANGITAIEGRIFAGTGDNASGESFININVSNTKPPVPTILGTFDSYKTNDIFGEADYGYIATDTNDKEIVIIDLTTSSYTEIGSFNAPGSTDASAVFISGNTGYMLQGGRLRNFDLSSKIGPRPAIDPDGVNLLGSTGTSLYVAGMYAYVTSTAATYNVLVIDVSNPANLHVVAGANINGLVAKDVAANSTGSRLYVVTEDSVTYKEFYIFRVDIPNLIFQRIGEYDTNGMNPKAVTTVPGNRVIIVGSQAEEYQVVNINDDSHPVHCGGLSIDASVNGIASVLEADGDAYSYIITGDQNAELKIIEGGPGGLYTSSGVFESSVFDAGYQTAFNRMTFTVTQPAQTEIKFQVASQDAIAGSCGGVTFSYVGIDGNAGSYFSAPGPIPLNDDAIEFENPGRCFRYKAYLSTSDTYASPILQDLTVNYSP